MIPGRLKAEDAPELAALVAGKGVLQLGCYCGKALVEVAKHASVLWVLDDFRYPGGIAGVGEELMTNVDREVPEHVDVNLLYGTVRGWRVPEGSADLRCEEVEVVYRDADRQGDEQEDGAFALHVLKGRGGLYVWHAPDGRLKWLTVQPVPVEVN